MSAPQELTQAQRDRLQTGHHLLSRPEMVRYWLLSEQDRKYIEERRRERNRLGFAVQLCLLRYPGWPLGPGAITLWNTAFLDRALNVLKEKGVTLPPECVPHVSPLGWDPSPSRAHIGGKAHNPLGATSGPFVCPPSTLSPLSALSVVFLPIGPVWPDSLKGRPIRPPSPQNPKSPVFVDSPSKTM